MKHLLSLILILLLIPCLTGFTQNKTVVNLTEACNFESTNIPLFAAYAEQADKEGLPKVATFFRAISKAASIHAANFQELLTKMGVTVTPIKTEISLMTPELNIQDALKLIRIEAGINYAEYLEQAKTDNEKSASKALRLARETEQQSLQLFVNVADALANENTKILPAFYWVCPNCGNLYDVPDPENECSFCNTGNGKFLKVI